MRTTALLLATAILTACAAAPAPEAPGIQGTITRITVADGVPTALLIEENPGETSGSAKDMVALTPETVLVREVAQGVIAAGFSELREGQRVAAWYSGP